MTSPTASSSPSSADDKVASHTSVVISQDNTSTTRNKCVVAIKACVPCRLKHLKCDGVKPCSRCRSHQLDCNYTISRRGYKGPRKPRNSINPSTDNAANLMVPVQQPQLSLSDMSTRHSSEDILQDMLDDSSLMLSLGIDTPLLCEVSALVNRNITPSIEPTWTISKGIRNACFDAFFRHVYPAHPFVLPKPHLLNILESQSLPYLEAAICYMGSLYVRSAPQAMLLDKATTLLNGASCPKDGFSVQANLLVAIGLDCNADMKRSLDFLNKAGDIALAIGMHQKEFANLYSQGSSILEESWRRTWWELYVISGMFAGIHQQNKFRLNDVFSDTLLPCEEQDYLLNYITLPRSLDDFDNMEFTEENVIFSSIAYRIAAVRNLSKVLQACNLASSDESLVHKADAYLVNWALHLPSEKTLFTEDGTLDEMMFQAHMITNASTIILHRQFSQLDSTPISNINACAIHSDVDGGQAHNIHTAKTLHAAENISKLITLPVLLTKHTHFFTCVITLASIVHLSHWAAIKISIDDGPVKQLIRLEMGALKTLAGLWPCARKANQQVKKVAREISLSRKLTNYGDFGLISTDDDFMRSLGIEDIISQEVQME